MDEEERLPPARELDEYTLSQLEVKKRKCLEDLQDAVKYSWGHRVSKRIGHDIYKILRYLSFFGIALIIISFIVMFLPFVFHPPDKENIESVLNPWSMGLLFGSLSLFIFSSNIALNVPARPFRRKLNDLEQVIRIKQEVEQGDDFSLDEDKHTEYKSSFKYDYKTKSPNPTLVKEVVTTIQGFLNSDGGRLVIGVSNNKELLGIENDLKILGDWDKFQLAIQDVLRINSDKPLAEFINIKKVKKSGKELCVITVRPYPKPVFFIEGNNQDEMYIREGNCTSKLTTKQAFDYITSHWVEKD
jgi:hypothetical protein